MELIIDFAFILGMVISFIILIALQAQRKKQIHVFILKTFFVFLFFICIHSYAEIHNNKFLYLLSYVFDYTAVWLFGPLFFIYIKSLFYGKKDIFKKNIYHLIPFFISLLIFCIPSLINKINNDIKFTFLSDMVEDNRAVVVFRDLYAMIYLILSLDKYVKYRNVMIFNFSSLSKNSFDWVKNLIIAMMLVIFSNFFMRSIELINGAFNWDVGYISQFMLLSFITYLGYYGIKQGKITLPEFLIEEVESPHNKKENPLEKLSRNEVQELEVLLKNVMENKRPYLDENLSLTRLSSLTEIPSKKLSQLLNHKLNTNFYDFVNSYRIDVFVNKLREKNNNNYSIMGLAYDCGFKNKGSFYRAFRKNLKQSPTEFLHKINE